MPSRSSGYGGYGQRPAYGAGRVGYSANRPSPSGGKGGGVGQAPTTRLRREPPHKGVAGSSLQLAKGDMVRHKAFGQGMVLSVQAMGGDALVEIAFDNVGTKRLMLKAAAAHMTKE